MHWIFHSAIHWKCLVIMLDVVDCRCIFLFLFFFFFFCLSCSCACVCFFCFLILFLLNVNVNLIHKSFFLNHSSHKIFAHYLTHNLLPVFSLNKVMLFISFISIMRYYDNNFMYIIRMWLVFVVVKSSILDFIFIIEFVARFSSSFFVFFFFNSFLLLHLFKYM